MWIPGRKIFLNRDKRLIQFNFHLGLCHAICSSIRISSFNFAVLSPPTTPVLMKMHWKAVARWAIVISVVSPERWLITVSIPLRVGKVDSLEGVGERPDLVWLDQNAVRRTLFYPFDDSGDAGDKKIIAADEAPVPDLRRSDRQNPEKSSS